MPEHYIEQRPWGQYEILKVFSVKDENGQDVCVKQHTVKPNSSLSYQAHKSRSEYWIFVQGQGRVVLDGEERVVKAGDMVNIPVGTKHRIINGNQEMILIEVTTGHYDEEDNTRFEDEYGRVKKN